MIKTHYNIFIIFTYTIIYNGFKIINIIMMKLHICYNIIW